MLETASDTVAKAKPAKKKGITPAPSGYWSDKSLACKATYAILENANLLNQFDSAVVPFAQGGKFGLEHLASMYSGGTSADQQGRAAQIARGFFKYILELYADRYKSSKTDPKNVLFTIRTLLLQNEATVADLAYLMDGYMVFPGGSK